MRNALARTLALTTVLTCGGISCGDDDDQNGNQNNSNGTTGTLVFKIHYGSDASPKPRSMNTCTITDVRAMHQLLEVTLDEVPTVPPGEVEWQELYSGNTEFLCSEFEAQATLAAGTYNAMRITQRNQLGWVVDCPGIGSVELIGLNNSDASPMDILPPTVLTPTGLYVADASDWTRVNDGESMGTFDIQAGGTTVLTWRSHFNTLDWNDADDNQTWSDGDSLDNWTLQAGETTMFSFDVEYQ